MLPGPAGAVRRLLDAVGDKWSLLCLYALDDGAVRFNALERRLVGVSQKVLAQTLRKLERSGLVVRTVYAEVPPRVEYKLSDLGRTLQPLTSAMCAWSRQHGHRLKDNVAEERFRRRQADLREAR
jgi:DNA-binding HxlR family transcriptional regulator